jgi:hypothetical protein
MSTKTYPWDLTPSQYFTLEVSQEDASHLNNGTEIEKEAIELILEHWDESNPFGLQIKQRYDFVPAERKLMEDALESQRLDQQKATTLLVRIAEETKQDVQSVAKKMEAIGTSSNIEEWMYPYVDEVLELSTDVVETNSILDPIQSTVLIQRAIPNWTEEHTEVLTSAIRARLSEIAAIEWRGKPKPQPEPEPQPSEDSSGRSKTSRATKNRTTTQ